MSKKTHDEAKEPDAFISTSEHVVKWLVKYRVPAIGLVVAVLVTSMGWVGFNYWRNRTEVKASNFLFQYESKLRDAESKRVAARTKDLKLKPNTESEYKEFLESPVNAWIEGLATVKNTRAAQLSALMLSQTLWEQKYFEPALRALQVPAVKRSVQNWVDAAWWLHKGVILLENQKADEAIVAFDLVLKSDKAKMFHPEALLKLGISYSVKGEREKAKAQYDRLEQAFPNSEAAKSAKLYRRWSQVQAHQDIKTSQVGGVQ